MRRGRKAYWFPLPISPPPMGHPKAGRRKDRPAPLLSLGLSDGNDEDRKAPQAVHRHRNIVNTRLSSIAHMSPSPSPSRWSFPEWDLPLSPATKELCDVICSKFNYDRVHEWQALAMQALLNGTDVVASSGTGSGKSLVFQGMTLAKSEAIVLVISPLISIMDNQVIALVWSLTYGRSRR